MLSTGHAAVHRKCPLAADSALSIVWFRTRCRLCQIDDPSIIADWRKYGSLLLSSSSILLTNKKLYLLDCCMSKNVEERASKMKDRDQSELNREGHHRQRVLVVASAMSCPFSSSQRTEIILFTGVSSHWNSCDYTQHVIRKQRRVQCKCDQDVWVLSMPLVRRCRNGSGAVIGKSSGYRTQSRGLMQMSIWDENARNANELTAALNVHDVHQIARLRSMCCTTSIFWDVYADIYAMWSVFVSGLSDGVNDIKVFLCSRFRIFSV